MTAPQLNPSVLKLLPERMPAFREGHYVTVRHVAGHDQNRRRGHYEFAMEGPSYQGKWLFSSGELQALAKAAAVQRTL